MKNLIQLLEPDIINNINNKIKLRFRDASIFKTPEALIMYEERILTEEDIFNLCYEEYGVNISTPQLNYVSADIIELYKECNCIPIEVDHVNSAMHIATIPEFANGKFPEYKDYELVCHKVPIYYYVQKYTTLYGAPTFLAKLSNKDVFDTFIREAIDLGSSDTCISHVETGVEITHNVRKKLRDSRFSLSAKELDGMLEYIRSSNGSAKITVDNIPEYIGVQIDARYRGRLCVTSCYYGSSLDIRVIDLQAFKITDLETLNIDENDVKKLKEIAFSDEVGLRIVAGPTNSGKNTTLQAGFKWKMNQGRYKIRSVEKPIEMVMPGVIQVNAETEEEYAANVDALIRQDPDICYLSEINNFTARKTLDHSDTAKPVFSTTHVNNIPGVLSRLHDLSGYSYDRIIECMHSVFYQKLERDEEQDKLLPRTIFFYFSEARKEMLYGKSIGEINLIIQSEIQKELWNN